ncbi:hypothetical protein MHYP_G00045480 [Metynnis hypsauchen]
MRLNNKQERPLQLQGEDLKETDRFIYLGSVVNTDGGADKDVRSWINKARLAFNTLRPMWNSKALSQRSKIRIFNTNVKAVLLYGSETWRVTNTISNKLHIFINKCLRHILNIRWPEKISNTELWTRTSQRAGPGMESSRKKKGGETKTDMEKICRKRSEVCRNDVDPAEEGGPEQSSLAGVVAALCSTRSLQD